MSTILYNTTNNTIIGTFNPYYTVDGQRPILTDGIVELTIKNTEKPSVLNTQLLETKWEMQGTEYVEVHTVRDKTEEELKKEKEAATPKEITKRQLLLFLYENINITNDDIVNMINNLENQTQRELLKIEWNFATVVDRTLPHVIEYAQLLGITEEQLAEIYYQAKDI